MRPLLGLVLSLLALPAFCDDTVADDIGVHMMARISELLSPEECQAFHLKLLGPEENVKDELERLSEKNNPISGRRRRRRRRRDILTTAQCRETLQQWLETEGDTMYWDRLSRALQLIGRADVSLELGKNLNQDKNLEIKKNVEEYHETVKHLTSSLLLDQGPEGSAPGRQRRQGSAPPPPPPLDQEEWDRLELIVERKALPPYNRSLFEWATPLATGVLSGFLTSFILVALAFYSFVWILNEGNAVSAPSPGGPLPAKFLRPPPASRGGIYYSFQPLQSYYGEAGDEAEESLR
ncbi:transmembrane and death domain protein 1-like [Thamnophis elegans]|uniref:transmembrane and death domain protein 1-like n=1 Tax=Thamnophis elegans TaxID=35005 RepID=UPI001378D86C|nr:transmembrane and death domain protein 1-like [Thamnophis elegans]